MKIEMKEVNVLGTKYTVKVKKHWKDSRLNNSDGICDASTKEIILGHLEKEPDSQRDLEAVSRKILRHEIVHAFLCESGLSENSDWAQNKELVDWIAIQGPKIFKAWQEANAL